MEYRKKYEEQYEYILDCMEPEEFVDSTPEQKIDNFIDKFHREYDNASRRKDFPFTLQRIAEYLKGLPQACSVDYVNYNIIQVGKDWGYITDEESENQFLNRWWNICAERIYELVRFYDREFIVEPYYPKIHG